MRLALMVEGQEGVTWEDWLGLARACEEHGVEALFRSDHYGSILSTPWRAAHDAWATISALGAVTERVRLGTLVSPATFRHPSVLARVATTADHTSGGRVEVGIGAGWYEREHESLGFPFDDARTRFERFAEHVEIVVRSWTEDGFDFEGVHYRLRGARAEPKPVQRPHPPLLLGGSAKPRSAALAARFAGEYNTPFASPAQCRERRRALDEACRVAGRDPETLPLSLMTLTVLAADEGELRDRLARVLELQGDPRDAEDVLAAEHDAWLVGTVEQVAQRLEAYRAAGVTRVMLQHLDHADLDMVGLLPALAGTLRPDARVSD
jgi:F420-dependent oxidoreductase-like protein